MIRAAAYAFVLALGGHGAAEAQADRNEQITTYEPWCGGKTGLAQCIEQILWVDQELKEREALAKRTGHRDTANRGLSLMGCYNYCTLRYFPIGTPQQCRASTTTFRQASKSRPDLLKTTIAGYLDRECRKT